MPEHHSAAATPHHDASAPEAPSSPASSDRCGASPISRLGDVWQLGPHRLMCGDAGSAEHVATLMEGRRADLVFTSPPYGQQRQYGSARELVRDWDGLMRSVFTALPTTLCAPVLVNLGLFYRKHEWQAYWEDWLRWMNGEGWRRLGWYIWDQCGQLPGDWRGRLGPSHEFIFHFGKRVRRPNKTVPCKDAGRVSTFRLRRADGGFNVGRPKPVNAFRVLDSVIRISRRYNHKTSVGSHPAVFPLALAKQIIEAFSDPADLVYDPFSGSATSLIAAEELGRVACGMEIDPVYVDLAVKRWEAHTGRVAQRLDRDLAIAA